jgi:hypothetical protein
MWILTPSVLHFRLPLLCFLLLHEIIICMEIPIIQKIDIKVAYLSKCHPQNVVEAYNIIKLNQLQHSNISWLQHIPTSKNVTAPNIMFHLLH